MGVNRDAGCGCAMCIYLLKNRGESKWPKDDVETTTSTIASALSGNCFWEHVGISANNNGHANASANANVSGASQQMKSRGKVNFPWENGKFSTDGTQ